MKTLNNIKALFLIGALSLVMISSCKKSEEEVQTTASLRVVNAFEGSVPQDFYQGTGKLQVGVTYNSSTSTTSTAAANVTSVLSFTNTSTTTVSSSAQVNLVTNGTYTVFYSKRADGSGEIVGFLEDNTATVAGKAKVRFANMGSVVGATVNITGAGGSSIATGILLKAATTYQSIDPGVDLSATMTGTVAATVIPGSTFQAGKIYTIWFDSSVAAGVKYHVVQQN